MEILFFIYISNKTIILNCKNTNSQYKHLVYFKILIIFNNLR